MSYIDNDIEIFNEEEDIEIDSEIIAEGEMVSEEFDAMELLEETIITSASQVDTSASSKAIAKVKKEFDAKKAEGKIRDYKSSDKALLDSAIKDKGLMKQAMGAIVGSVIGAGVGFGAGKGASVAGNVLANKAKNTALGKSAELDANPQSTLSQREKAENNFNKKAKAASHWKKEKGFKDYKNSVVSKASSIKNKFPQKKKKMNAELDVLMEDYEIYTESYAEEIGITNPLCEEAVAEMFDFYIDNLCEEILNEKLGFGRPSNNTISKGVGTVAGATAGAVAGKAIAKKIASNMKYSVFTMSGLTILSIYSAAKEAKNKGKSVCYAIAVTDKGKLFMKKIKLTAK